MNPVDFDSVGILQIGGNRYGFRPLEIYTEFGRAPIMKGEFLQDVFQASNRYQGMGVSCGKISEPPAIKNVYFNDPVTVVIWDDGTKTIVRCQPGDTYSKETGLALCIAKKYLGNKGNFNEVFKKWIPEEVEPVEDKVLMSFSVNVETDEVDILTAHGVSVGDTVRVVNCGKHYPSYKDWILDHVTDPDDQRKWSRNTRSWGNGSIGLVKYLAPHANRRDVLAYVDFGNSCSIIGTDGLEKVEEG